MKNYKKLAACVVLGLVLSSVAAVANAPHRREYEPYVNMYLSDGQLVCTAYLFSDDNGELLMVSGYIQNPNQANQNFGAWGYGEVWGFKQVDANMSGTWKCVARLWGTNQPAYDVWLESSVNVP